MPRARSEHADSISVAYRQLYATIAATNHVGRTATTAPAPDHVPRSIGPLPQRMSADLVGVPSLQSRSSSVCLAALNAEGR